MSLTGEGVSLMTYSRDRCHELYRSYVSDPLMTYDDFEYDKEKIDKYYDIKVLDCDRRFFAIVAENKVIGEIQLKYIDFESGVGTLSVILTNNGVKNKGYGTEAIKLMLEYASTELELKKVLADAIHRNLRSRHILEKIGFKYIGEDDILVYFEYTL